MERRCKTFKLHAPWSGARGRWTCRIAWKGSWVLCNLCNFLGDDAWTLGLRVATYYDNGVQHMDLAMNVAWIQSFVG
jgi:hypothetical protein